MYLPANFRNNDIPAVIQFIRDNPFAALITPGEGLPDVSHIPVEWVEAGGEYYLEGHVSRANPQGRDFDKGKSALVIFQGPHSYVSSSWYGHINAPTWNYIAVHVTGKIRKMEEGELHQSLRRIVDRFESTSGKPFRMEHMPEDMLEKYLKGITGFVVKIETIEGKWKMSQNRNREDYENIITELEKLGDFNARRVAEEMRKAGHTL
jgi:transcriptional regulator